MKRLFWTLLIVLGVSGMVQWMMQPPAEDPDQDASGVDATYAEEPDGPALETREPLDGNVVEPPAPGELEELYGEDAATAKTPKQVRVSVVPYGESSLEGIRIRARAASNDGTWTHHGVTDADGNVTLDDLPDGPLVFQVASKGWLPRSTVWLFDPARPEDMPELDAERGVAIRGRVVDDATGKPVAGASVARRGWGSKMPSVETDAEGWFVHPGVEDDDEDELHARAPGYALGSVAYATGNGGVHPPEPVIRLRRGGTISGRVLLPNGEPAAGATVKADPRTPPEMGPTSDHRMESYGWHRMHWAGDLHDRIRTATTDEDGRYVIDGLEPERSYRLTAALMPHAPSAANGPIQLENGASLPGITLPLREPGTVAVTLKTESNTRLDTTEDVRLFGEGWQHAFGFERQHGTHHYVFMGLAPGTWDVYAGSKAFIAQTKRIEVHAGRTTAVEIVLDAGASIEGIVVGEDGRPVPGAGLRAWPVDSDDFNRQRKAETDAEGRFVVDGLTPGAHYVTADSDFGARTTKEPLQVEAPARGVELRLVQQGSVRFALEAPEGRDVPDDVTVMVFHADGMGSGGTHQPVGDAIEIKALEPGTYEIIVEPPGYAWFRKEVTIQQGQAVDLGTFRLDDGVTIAGRIVDDVGAPVAEAWVRCSSLSDRAVTTNADGRFRLERFPAMELGLYFEKNGYATTSVLVPKGGASDLQIELPRGAMVTGKVHWPDGAEPTFVRILLAPPGAKRSIETETQIDGTAQEYVWYEDAETLFVDEDGTIYKNAIRPGTYIGYWVDEKQVSHEVGRWTFEATKDYNVEIRLPKR